MKSKENLTEVLSSLMLWIPELEDLRDELSTFMKGNDKLLRVELHALQEMIISIKIIISLLIWWNDYSGKNVEEHRKYLDLFNKESRLFSDQFISFQDFLVSEFWENFARTVPLLPESEVRESLIRTKKQYLEKYMEWRRIGWFTTDIQNQVIETLSPSSE